MEQELYKQEQIEWKFLPFPDNSAVLTLFQDPARGLFSILDETCAIKKSTPKDLMSKYKSRATKNDRFYMPKKQKKVFFGVRHFAGDVVYSVEDFISKNRNSLNSQFNDSMQTSENQALTVIFNKHLWGADTLSTKSILRSSVMSVNSSKIRKGKMIASVTKRFNLQLNQLIATINQSLSLYVRCIKPNSKKSPDLFDSFDVNRQLKCAGMLEALKIRKHGFPVRIGFRDFYNKFWKLFAVKLSSSCKLGEVRKIIEENFRKEGEFDETLLQIGKTKVFMKKEAMDQIEKKYYKKIQRSVIVIQKNVRMFLSKKKYRNFLKLKKVFERKLNSARLFKQECEKIRIINLKKNLINLENTLSIKKKEKIVTTFDIILAFVNHKKAEELRIQQELKSKMVDKVENMSNYSSVENNWNQFEEAEPEDEQLRMLDELEGVLAKKNEELTEKNNLLNLKDNEIESLKRRISFLEQKNSELSQKMEETSRKLNESSYLLPNSGRENKLVESIQIFNNHELVSTIEQLQMEKELQGDVFSNLLTILKLKTLENKLIYKFFYSNDHKTKGLIADNLGKLTSDEKILKKKLNNKIEELTKIGDENYFERFSYLRASFIRGSNVSFQRPRV